MPVVIIVMPDVLVVAAAALIALPAGVPIARSLLLVGPVQVAPIVGSGHDDVAPLSAATCTALDVRREVRVVVASAISRMTVVPRRAGITIFIGRVIIVHARVKAPPPATKQGS